MDIISPPQLQGLYAITDSTLTPPETIVAQVEHVLKAGVKVIQYRDKQHPFEQQKHIALQLRQLTKAHNALLIINDNLDLCLEVQADGVHLGQQDMSIASARKQLNQNYIIGATCHGSTLLADQAQREGADYLAFGRFFPSATKPQAKPANLEQICHYIRHCRLPCVAIGGITMNNASPLIEAGFTMLAVVHDIFSQADIYHHCQRYQALFTHLKSSV